MLPTEVGDQGNDGWWAGQLQIGDARDRGTGFTDDGDHERWSLGAISPVVGGAQGGGVSDVVGRCTPARR
jgi:hypothetical protein